MGTEVRKNQCVSKTRLRERKDCVSIVPKKHLARDGTSFSFFSRALLC
jgi:hypothetical protein